VKCIFFSFFFNISVLTRARSSPLPARELHLRYYFDYPAPFPFFLLPSGVDEVQLSADRIHRFPVYPVSTGNTRSISRYRFLQRAGTCVTRDSSNRRREEARNSERPPLWCSESRGASAFQWYPSMFRFVRLLSIAFVARVRAATQLRRENASGNPV